MRRLFLALLILQLVPVWWWTYFPSQDGPSHLYNAEVIARYSTTPLYQEFYTLRLSPAGNVLSQIVQVALSRVLPPLIAEKVLISLYLVLFGLGFRYLIRSVAPDDEAYAFFAFVLAPNWFLHMGFWNFCLSMPLFFFALGCFLRNAKPSIFLALVWLTYFSHIIAWGLLAGCAGWLWLWKWRERRWLLVMALTPIVPAMLFLKGTGPSKIVPATMPQDFIAWLVAFTGFVHSFGMAEWLSAIAAICVVFALALASVRKLIRSPLLYLAVILYLIALIAPVSYGAATFLGKRSAFFGLAIFVSATAAARPASVRIAFLFAACALAATLARIQPFISWNTQIRAYNAFANQIPGGSRVLPLDTLQPDTGGTRPLAHALGYQTPRPLINLRNYEAGTPYFPVQFRPQKSPFTRIGGSIAMEKNPPQIDLSTYEWIDYVLVAGPYTVAGPGFALTKQAGGDLELKLYRRTR